MYEYIQGNLIELTPTFAVVESKNIGYFINISLNTYSKLTGSSRHECREAKAGKDDRHQTPDTRHQCKLYIHQVIREDVNALFGFFDKKERELFRFLISVSGIGANSARMMLSSLSPSEIQQAIITNNVSLLKSIKGIGEKTAQRIIIDLKDKLGKDIAEQEIPVTQYNNIKDQSLSALVMLGFAKNNAEKVIAHILSEDNNLSVEELVKKSLQKL